MRRYNSFDRSAEHIFVKEIIDCIEELDIPKFQIAYLKFSKIHDITQGIQDLLHLIVKEMEKGDEIKLDIL